MLPTSGLLPRFPAKRASERSRTSPKETEKEGVQARWKVGEQTWPQENPRSGRDSPESQGPRAAGSAVHPSLGLLRSDHGPAPTPAPHSRSRPEPGRAHGRTCGSYQKKNLQPVAYTLTQPPSS